ncbi:MAG: SagB/ThcOx family dehydrogenase [Gammaproteobacteria bacterium]|nr:SagB/ThcOx family dehydrogenase [Gammaproteobacteria bacterium]
MNDIATITHYHEATKHHPRRQARSLGYMDWATQPDPFRRFTGAQLTTLPVQETDDSPPYEDVFMPGKIPTHGLTLASIGRFFECSLAISAWKRAGDSRWALRINPSSGNLHPTEGYCLLPAMAGIHDSPGVYHYAPREHGLERRGEFPQAVWDKLPPDIFLVGLSSIAWREAWKYGERAFRYCQHDCGHAYMAIDVAARMLGWRVALLDTVGDEEIAAILGLDRADEFRANEEEIPELLIAVYFGAAQSATQAEFDNRAPAIPEDFFQGVADGAWFGKADPLSRAHHDWPLIHTADRATRKPGTIETLLPDDPGVGADPRTCPDLHGDHQVDHEQGFSAWQVIKKRRSAVSMDGTTSLDRQSFYRMLSRIMESGKNLPWPPKVHIALFVHRVDALPPGLYLLVRHSAMQGELQKATHDHFHWKKPTDCPTALPLYFLQEGNLARIAKTLSCVQDIAGDGAFSAGMIAEFQSSLDTFGAWFYKRLFWETGMIGQLLYLEAEAVGLSGTGIGCFFDDAVHELLGFRDRTFQSLYHFTVGGAVLDPRVSLD